MPKTALKRVRPSDKLTNTAVKYGNCKDCGRYGRLWSTTRVCADDNRVATCEKRKARSVARELARGDATTELLPE